jgi:hypothetical protein
MDQQQLSSDGRAALEAFNLLSTAEKGTFVALASTVLASEIALKVSSATPEQLATAQSVVEAGIAAQRLTIDQMKAELRAADCLYDDSKIWKQLGATKVPKIPDAVIQEAYEKGGRVVLKCSSISEKADALRTARRDVYFGGTAAQRHYAENVSKPEWIVVQSHIDRNTLGSPKSKVVTSEMPAPTPEDWFSAIAYAKLDGGRQPKGCESLWAFTTESGTVVGSDDVIIFVFRNVFFDPGGRGSFGAARFGRPRN